MLTVIAITLLYVRVHVLYSLCAYICMYNITQTVVTTAFCRFLRKKLRPRATSASTFPSPSLPSYFRQKKNRADRRYPSVANSKRSRLLVRANSRSSHRLPCDGGRRSFVFLIAFVSFSPSFFFFSLSTEDRRKANESHRAGQ